MSKREREIFYLLIYGKISEQIAKMLFISPKTVETHRSRIRRKLNLHNPADLVRYAVKFGLFDASKWEYTPRRAA